MQYFFMKLYPGSQNAAERAAAEITSITMGEWRVAILSLLQELDEVADGYSKQQEYQYEVLSELRRGIRARLSMENWELISRSLSMYRER
jgi:hypothetical protein